MRKNLFTATLCVASLSIHAQSEIGTNALFVNPQANVTIPYKCDDAGVSLPVEWGFDTAWLSDANVQKGVNFIGKDKVGVVRVSFRANAPLVNGTDLTADMKEKVAERANIVIQRVGKKVPVVINCDQEAGIDDWYHGTASGTKLTSSHPERWVQNIKEHIKLFQEKGLTVIGVSPFNEPDYGWNQGTYHKDNEHNTTMEEMRLICKGMKEDPFFDGMRISGGNTLNCDCALPWYNYMKDYLDEGNTHQLAGEFDTYAGFFAAVRADGNHATADELHNIMEAFVGAEYGMQTGIWWGSAERARAELMTASDGVRLGYGESRGTWMAGSVYRNTDNSIRAFIGQSERQAQTTSFAFRSDRPVYYDGQGPTCEMYVSVKGGTGYQVGTTNGERVYDVTYGEDIRPYIDGKYYIVNRYLGHHLLTAPNNNNGTQLTLAKYTGRENQQWELHPCPDTRGGDYSYHSISNVANGKAADVENFSLTNGTKIMLWDNNGNNCQTYWLEYADDGYFFIRNQNSAMSIQAPSSVGGGITQSTYKKTDKRQQWRLVPVGVTPEFDAPAAPTGLKLQEQSASIRLDWDVDDADATITGCNVLRSNSANGGFEVIAREVTGGAFVDHDLVAGQTYYYKVKAVDSSLNTSEASEMVSGKMKDGENLIAVWSFDSADSLRDASENLNNILTVSKPSFTGGKIGDCLYFNGSSQFAQLPYGIASWPQLTFCAWVKWTSTNKWERIFDFGNDADHYMFLSPSNGSEMVFGIKNGGAEETLKCSKLPNLRWVHVAVTMGNEGVTMYVDGESMGTTSNISVRPSDIVPTFNYLGRSQFASDPMFKGSMDDVRLYNYALSAEQIRAIADMTDKVEAPQSCDETKEGMTYDLGGRRATIMKQGQVYINNGNKIIK